MFCENCGKHSEERDNFCIYCGNPLQAGSNIGEDFDVGVTFQPKKDGYEKNVSLSDDDIENENSEDLAGEKLYSAVYIKICVSLIVILAVVIGMLSGLVYNYHKENVRLQQEINLANTIISEHKKKDIN